MFLDLNVELILINSTNMLVYADDIFRHNKWYVTAAFSAIERAQIKMDLAVNIIDK